MDCHRRRRSWGPCTRRELPCMAILEAIAHRDPQSSRQSSDRRLATGGQSWSIFPEAVISKRSGLCLEDGQADNDERMFGQLCNCLAKRRKATEKKDFQEWFSSNDDGQTWNFLVSRPFLTFDFSCFLCMAAMTSNLFTLSECTSLFDLCVMNPTTTVAEPTIPSLSYFHFLTSSTFR